MIPSLSPPSNRIAALDSVRGIAALIVVFWHCFNWMSEAAHMQMGWLVLTPLRILINGEGAVVIFFVLSGFVLALPYFRVPSPDYRRFMLKRFCRIGIPYYAAVLMALGLYFLLDVSAPHGSGIWVRVPQTNDVLIDATLILRHIFAFMLGAGEDTILIGPAWSLIHEMRISALFPVLVLLMVRPRLGIPVAVGLYGVALWLTHVYGKFSHFPDAPNDVLSAYLATVYFTPCFMLGILLAARRERIVAYLTRLPDFITMLLWFLILGVFCYYDAYKIRQPLVMGASALLIMLAQSTGLAVKILNWSVLRWLGRISYSLYLVHVPLIYFMSQQWGGDFPPYVDVVGIVITALLVATLMQRYIEVPAIALGTRLARRLG